MPDRHAAPAIVVGIDGSAAAVGAAVWAIDEAVSRDIPLKLVYVIYRADVLGIDPGTDQQAVARTALSEACRAVEATGRTVKLETEVLNGNPLATLIELSRSATMVCVGALGVGYTCHRAGTTAAALAGSAGCPVAVIRPPGPEHRIGTGQIVAEVDVPADKPDNNAVLSWAMAEARLRDAPLRVVTSHEEVAAALQHRIDHWAQRYPDVPVEPLVVVREAGGDVTQFLAGATGGVQLFVSGIRDRRSLGQPGDAGGSSVLTVGQTGL